MAIDFSSLDENPDYFEPMAAEVWLMDDHRWALFVWEQHRQKVAAERYSLMHADYHWDSNDEFLEDAEARAKLAAADVDGLRAMTAAREYIKYE